MVSLGLAFVLAVSIVALVMLVGHWLSLRHTREMTAMKHRHEADKRLFTDGEGEREREDERELDGETDD